MNNTPEKEPLIKTGTDADEPITENVFDEMTERFGILHRKEVQALKEQVISAKGRWLMYGMIGFLIMDLIIKILVKIIIKLS